MQAIVMREFGDPSVLHFGNHPKPVARPGWVSVRLEASATSTAAEAITDVLFSCSGEGTGSRRRSPDIPAGPSGREPAWTCPSRWAP